ncbi:subunit of carbon monoxide dehydrogenase [Bordetella pertussis]|nr:subunit of carbon monoxide dehydrogenase [Bordetella pertussis]
MEFTNTFHVSLPLDEAWQLMLDVPRIMPCRSAARRSRTRRNRLAPCLRGPGPRRL